MGCIMYGIYFFFAQGVRFTATSRASFIVGAYIIFVPFVYILIRRKFPRLQDFAGTALCLIGLGVILQWIFTGWLYTRYLLCSMGWSH